MSDERGFLAAIRADPDDLLHRSVYADWLDERGDRRGDFLRLHQTLRDLSPDHARRPDLERDLSRLRSDLEERWLAIVEPERIHLYRAPAERPRCACFDQYQGTRQWTEPRLHVEPQDTECAAWRRLTEVVEEAAGSSAEEFAPGERMDPADWNRIVTLPATIAKLTAVKRLHLYGSNLVRLPPEIGEMSNLEEFDPYTSYRLHWFPYEIIRCRNLRDSRVSTRALYGNYKHRPPFPRLEPAARPLPATRPCSVCNAPFEDAQAHRVWVSLRVATDVLPLLVNACSKACIEQLPTPPEGYVQHPHRGGSGVRQPDV